MIWAKRFSGTFLVGKSERKALSIINKNMIIVTFTLFITIITDTPRETSHMASFMLASMSQAKSWGNWHMVIALSA